MPFHLRLVAGTDVIGMQQVIRRPVTTVTSVRRRQPTVPKSVTSVVELEAFARKTIYDIRLGGEAPTIKELLVEYNQAEITSQNFEKIIGMATRLHMGFSAIGLLLHAAHLEMELDTKVFGIVVYPKTLLEVRPALKSCESVLEGLTF